MGWGRKSYLGQAEIAPFSSRDFSWSSKHDTFCRVVLSGYLGRPLSTITFTDNSHADKHFFYKCFYLLQVVSGQLPPRKIPPIRVRVWCSVSVKIRVRGDNFPRGGDCPKTVSNIQYEISFFINIHVKVFIFKFDLKSVTEMKSSPGMKKFLCTREFHLGMKRVELHPGMRFYLKENLPLSMETYNKTYLFSFIF